ncbi:MAG: hypothetical protein GEV12_14400 [Micromonosporaceae bacterium]|nr:hypothetical protein [Micromonosporaceae bacterium]
MTQHTETLTSLREHYQDAVNRGDTDRAIDIASTYRKLTDRLISEDIDPEPPVSDNPAPWLAWRHRQMMGAAIIV